MEWKKISGGIKIFPDGAFDLKNTFDCGQCFRWNEREDGSYEGIVRGRYARLYRDGDGIVIENCTEDDLGSVWLDYFDLRNDYDSIRKEISDGCPQLTCAVESIDGIRILAQEPWEALCSFIISQNNNIPRIKGIIERLCASFGDEIDGGRSFPTAQRLAVLSPEELAPLRAGFRARYIIDAARKVSEGSVRLDKMYEAPIDGCRRELMTITGVGQKVAECTLLYGLHRLEAFPVDVWMKKALSDNFAGVSPDSIGRYAGVAQQYIFHYSRLAEGAVKGGKK